jgi:hypothetical protein
MPCIVISNSPGLISERSLEAQVFSGSIVDRLAARDLDALSQLGAIVTLERRGE